MIYIPIVATSPSHSGCLVIIEVRRHPDRKPRTYDISFANAFEPGSSL